MLVYKHEMHFGGHFSHVKTQYRFLFQVNHFFEQNDAKGLKIEDWSTRCPSNWSQTPKCYKIGISQKHLKHLDDKWFESNELKILKCMQKYSIK